MKICANLKCERPVQAVSLCSMHYQRMLRARTGEQKIAAQIERDELKEKRAARPKDDTEQAITRLSEPGTCTTLTADERERIFWPKGYEHPGFDIRKWDDARALCFECPIREACLEVALEQHEVARHTGIWGATTPSMRAKRIKDRNRKLKAA